MRVQQDIISLHEAEIFFKHCYGSDYSHYHNIFLSLSTNNTISSVSDYLREVITQGNYKQCIISDK
jgi:hypothetical protein